MKFSDNKFFLGKALRENKLKILMMTIVVIRGLKERNRNSRRRKRRIKRRKKRNKKGEGLQLHLLPLKVQALHLLPLLMRKGIGIDQVRL